jgi:formate hydrogenlyase subunit 4
MPFFQILVHALVVLTMPPLLLGVINRLKSRVGGRRGPPLLQSYFDLVKLLQKGSVFSRTTTWVFLAGPVASVATALVAAALVPLGSTEAPVHFDGDLILFAYLFGLGRFFTVLAALDTGSSFEGMGGAREATFSCLAEPALFLGLLAGVSLSGGLSLSDVFGGGSAVVWSTAGAPLVLVVVSFFILLLAENSRIPFDDPNTHLELTMIHEVMVLDHSGPALAFIEYGAALKLFLFGALLVRLLVPLNALAPGTAWMCFVASMIGVAVAVGIVESTMARIRLLQIPRLLVAACLLSAFGLILVSR